VLQKKHLTQPALSETPVYNSLDSRYDALGTCASFEVVKSLDCDNMRQPTDWDKAVYACCYCGQFMTEQEQLAERHLVAVRKASSGRTERAAELELDRVPPYFREMLSDDPQVLMLASDGYKSFVLRTGLRILKEHSEDVLLNCCPRCGGIARTPTARQCRYCAHDWHPVRKWWHFWRNPRT
jgi:hypothetical protein